MYLLKTLNAFFGIAFIVIGFFLPSFDFVHVLQAPGDDAYLIIQGHWVVSGGLSLFVASSQHKTASAYWATIIWGFLNYWLAGHTIFGQHWDFLWVFALPALTTLNFIQLLKQNEAVHIDEQEDLHLVGQSDEYSEIPPDYFPVNATGSSTALFGIAKLIVGIGFSIAFMSLLFFYMALIEVIILKGARIEFQEIPSSFGTEFYNAILTVVSTAVIYIVLMITQVVFEKLAISDQRQIADDANRSLSLQERKFIEKSLYSLVDYLEAVKFPRWYMFIQWLSIPPMIAFMMAVPMTVIVFQTAFVDSVQLAGLTKDVVIVDSGPALIGGALSGGLFGVGVFWSMMQWLGGRFRSIGEYLHANTGWNSFDNSARAIHDYGKIFTRQVRLRRYTTDHPVDPQQVIFDAFNEHAGVVYKTTIFLAVAMCLFTILDMNWRRVSHIDGFHYSDYLEFQGHDLTLDDVTSVDLRCFRSEADDDGVAKLGVDYVLVFSNHVQSDFLRDEIDGALLSKVEKVDAVLTQRGVPFDQALRQGKFLFRNQEGFMADCEQALADEYEPEIAGRIWRLVNRE